MITDSPTDNQHESQDTAPEYEEFLGTNERLTWEDLAPEDRLQLILSDPHISAWLEPEALDVLVYFRPIAQTWALIKARYKECKGNAFDLERAVDAQRQAEQAARATEEAHAHRNGTTPGPEPADPYSCPELPAIANAHR